MARLAHPTYPPMLVPPNHPRVSPALQGGGRDTRFREGLSERLKQIHFTQTHTHPQGAPPLTHHRQRLDDGAAAGVQDGAHLVGSNNVRLKRRVGLLEQATSSTDG